MAEPDEEAFPDPTTITWRSIEWIQAQPEGLNSNNVLNYFAESTFWDPLCNNATLQMQTRYNDLKDLNIVLKKMKGIEFQVVLEKPPVLWVIRKQNRLNEWEVSPVATFYVWNNNIYQAPNLYSIIGNRVVTFNKAYNQVEFHPATGYTWKSESSKARMIQQQQPIELVNFRSFIFYTTNFEFRTS
ncbi:1011_t:CDS:2 [Diversispora eburnea]|uniref:Mediator of RNA polymerase II transcription subunit 6 n=1 Tax=Diversispora eburnea TaxID=1213867 RepID=A0A9N9BIX2_9GLOM|nr:1011_t:CDS:2 [Diversispora eburnea]